MKTNVLVTAIGSFSASAVIDGLKKAGCKVVGCDIHDRYLLGCGKDVDTFYKVPYCNDNECYVNGLIHICEMEGISLLFPLTDVEIDVLNSNRDRFDRIGVELCMSNKEAIDICRDKYATYELLRDSRVEEIIESFPLDDFNDKNLNYPIIIKPRNGRSSEGIYVVNSSEKMAYLKSVCNSANYIYQNYLVGNIVTVDVCRDKRNNKTVCVAREELIRTGNGAGVSVYTFEDFDLRESVIRIAEILDVEGVVNFEYIKTYHGYKFVECNPRFSGGIAFSKIAGYDFVFNAYKYYKGEPIDNNPGIQSRYIVKKYVEIVTS